MTKRELVTRTLLFQDVPYVPWSFRFTQEARKKFSAATGGMDITDFANILFDTTVLRSELFRQYHHRTGLTLNHIINRLINNQLNKSSLL